MTLDREIKYVTLLHCFRFNLNRREQDVVLTLVRGYSVEQVAGVLGFSTSWESKALWARIRMLTGVATEEELVEIVTVADSPDDDSSEIPDSWVEDLHLPLDGHNVTCRYQHLPR